MKNFSYAVPKLQIFIPGAYYDFSTETWVINSFDYELWIIGAQEEVYDVKVAFAVPEGEDGSITLTWLDPSSASYGSENVTQLILNEAEGMSYDDYRASYANGAPESANTYAFVTNSTPLMGNGKPVPPHGVFPSDFFEYYIGNFSLSEKVADYSPPEGYDGQSALWPDDFSPSQPGEIKKFRVVVEGYSWVDIVAYDHYVQTNGKAKYVFSPFSHDGGSGSVPEPATLLLMATGVGSFFVMKRTKRK